MHTIPMHAVAARTAYGIPPKDYRDQALRPQADADRLALALLAAVQGGLLLALSQRTIDALEAAIDTVIAQIHDQAAPH
ncbi:hypothetical protein ACFV2U_47400 [Streptomyces sp. NPDC059697]|uniref:hypothetical protein n=1 Tax=Streptomyces sp. NPDC059697 TaxID=3346912 RepID=UPI0036CC0ED5